MRLQQLSVNWMILLIFLPIATASLEGFKLSKSLNQPVVRTRRQDFVNAERKLHNAIKRGMGKNRKQHKKKNGKNRYKLPQATKMFSWDNTSPKDLYMQQVNFEGTSQGGKINNHNGNSKSKRGRYNNNYNYGGKLQYAVPGRGRGGIGRNFHHEKNLVGHKVGLLANSVNTIEKQVSLNQQNLGYLTSQVDDLMSNYGTGFGTIL